MRVWCDRKFSAQARGLLGRQIRVDVIPAGKLRRYANLNFWYRWFSPYHIVHTHIPNLIDLFRIAGGFICSLVKLKLWRPDVVFCKGGYVCLPVGLVAHLYRIPLVIHDSDMVPGLTNRVLSRYADYIGTGMPVKNYPGYPAKRTKFVGIPVRPEIVRTTDPDRHQLKRQLGLDPNRPLILAMGGGLGATEINNAISANAIALVHDGYDIILLSGRGKHVEVDSRLRDHFIVHEFMDQIATAMRAADIVVTRAGATTMAELAAIGSATIIVPSPYLAGDHQTKNARIYEKARAAVVINQFRLDKNPQLLLVSIRALIADPARRHLLQKHITEFYLPNALADMTDMIIAATRQSR